MDTDEGRKAKERVRTFYPHSIVIRDIRYESTLSVIASVRNPEVLGCGNSFDEAWIDAAKDLR